MKTNKSIFYLIIIILLIFAHQSMAQESNNDESIPENVSIGKVISVENKVTITRNEADTIIAKAELPLFAGDQIITDEKSSVKFSLNEGSHFMIGESSEVAIDEYAELAKESEEESSVLRVVVGFLRSTIKEYKGESAQPSIYTPTAVAGVRGTVFDTVVSLDGATAIVVDEGRVEVDCDTVKTVLDKGKMAELNEEAKDLKPVSAIPLEKRNWRVWREKRKKKMIEKLPHMLARQRKHFEKWSNQYAAYTSDVKKAEMAVAQAAEEVRKARESGNETQIQTTVKQLREQSHSLKRTIKKSRHQLNRSKAISKHLSKIEKYVKKHKARFKPKELALIQSDFAFVKQKKKHMKKSSRDLIKKLRKTVRKSKKLRKAKIRKLKKKANELKKKAKIKKTKNKAKVQQFIKKIKTKTLKKKKDSGKKHKKKKVDR